MSQVTEQGVFEEDFIEVWGAREHNLKDIYVRIPRNQFVVITGVSGSGKSSLAFDIIFNEGQRRYMETFTSYARQFIGEMERPDVDKITGLSPVISIEQKTTNRNPRSTVGTVTEIYDFLRLLYARTSDAYSYNTGKKMVRFSEAQIIDNIYEHFEGKNIVVLAPLVRARKGHYRELFEYIRKQGFTKARVDEEMVDLKANYQVDRYKTHNIEVVVDRLKVSDERKERLIQSLQSALKMGKGFVMVMDHDSNQVSQFSKHLVCQDTGLSYEEPSPNAFSFNSPYGACPTCNGLGVVTEVDLDLMMPDRSVSINKGGIVPIGEARENMLFKQLREIAKKFKFNLSSPIDEIPEEALNVILYGGDSSIKIPVDWGTGEYGDLATEGFIAMMKRWYADSSSDKIRQWAEDFMKIETCHDCHGSRLKIESRHFKINEKDISQLANWDIYTLREWIIALPDMLTDKQLAIGKDILKELRERLGFLLDVGLDYLSLNRQSGTLSGGESQRIRLATQIGSQLTGITYILDEPSIGLHQRDNQKLISALRNLCDIGNSVLVVEHDRDIMLASDYLIDMGPLAGVHGGEIVAAGSPDEFQKLDSHTANYLNHKDKLEIPTKRRSGNGHVLSLINATGNNLKNVSVELPLGTFICVTGVSGSGKSTLVNDTLYPILRKHFYKSRQNPLAYDEIKGLNHLDKVIEIDQSPIGRTPRSNPATYIDVFTLIRNLYAEVPEAKIRGYKAGRFSFNVKGGRCETCQGGGRRVIEMQFLPDVEVHCEACNGKRYNRETLEILYKGKSIYDILEMRVDEAVIFFEAIPQIWRKVKTLQEVGLGYICLGQSSTTLSGGEAQRIKLAEELSKKDTGNTFYILDEPTTGLHFHDIKMLLDVIQRLVDKGNSVLVIEHNMDVIKMADHIIDIGPEGGNGGGTVTCQGSPEVVAKSNTHTGKFLAMEL